MAPPCRLAIHRQNGLLHAGRRGRGRTQRLQPVHKTGLKGARTQRHQHATKDILARHPVGQVQRVQKELFFQNGPLGNRSWSARTGQHCHQSDDDNTDQRMLQIDGGARILQLLKMQDDLVQRDTLNVRHRSLSVRRRECSYTDNVIQTNCPGRKRYRLPNLLKVRAGPVTSWRRTILPHPYLSTRRSGDRSTPGSVPCPLRRGSARAA